MNGNDLINLGYETGPHFAEMLKIANVLEENGIPEETILEAVQEIYNEYLESKKEDLSKRLNLRDSKEEVPMHIFLDEGTNQFELDNNKSVFEHVDYIRTLPTITEVAVMPDACPSGGTLGTIPVGTVAVAKNAIHPGMHSADICCSMFLTTINTQFDVGHVLDAVQEVSHFGTGGRKDMKMGHGSSITKRAENNRYMASVQMFKAMSDHLGTQGDGNHFFFVGQKESTGEMTFVTHHGSRKPGALLYKEGMRVANLFREEYMPELGKHLAWIPYDTDEGREYWEALQIIRAWTEYNHRIIHHELMLYLGLDPYRDVTDRFWNEHNFVFKKDDLFYHAKGSTPSWGTHAHDADGRTIIPLNMGEPILIVEHNEKNTFGFSPHGAGRNMSRTQFMKNNGGKTVEQIMKEQTGHVDARFYSGKPDMSELPGAYKNAKSVEAQIVKYNLANIVDRVLPLGSMMAGEQEKPWLKKKSG